jgi:hypothetical protein
MTSNCVFQANAFINPILVQNPGDSFNLVQLGSEQYLSRLEQLQLRLYKDNTHSSHDGLHPMYSSVAPSFSTREVSTPKLASSRTESSRTYDPRKKNTSAFKGILRRFSSLLGFVNEALNEHSPPVTENRGRTRSLSVSDAYKRHKKDNQYQVISLVDIGWLKAHEEIVSEERVFKLHEAVKEWKAFRLPLLVDVRSGAILDGHHRYAVGRRMGLSKLPAILVDYLHDEKIKLDVWPECGLDCLTKEEVISMSLSEDVFPPKTSKHDFEDHSLPPINVTLEHFQ